MRLFALALLTVALALPVFAADGVLEINQTCAVTTGCFPGDTAGFPVTITTPASYVLTSTLTIRTAPNATAILISTRDVTVDLGGFTVQGTRLCEGTCLPPGGSGKGIDVLNSPAITGVEVRNGKVAGFESDGVDVRDSGTVRDLHVFDNGGSGITAGKDSTVSGNTAYNNEDTGILAGSGSSISGNTAYSNDADGIRTIASSTVWGNTTTSNGDDGIVVRSDSHVSGNTSSQNAGSGIVAQPGQFPILFPATDNRIDGNNVTSNGDHGIEVLDTLNLIIRNSARDNSNGNYSIVSGNRVGLIVVPLVSGAIENNGPGAGLNTTRPWANIAY